MRMFEPPLRLPLWFLDAIQYLNERVNFQEKVVRRYGGEGHKSTYFGYNILMRGFALLELLIVVFIIGLLAWLSVSFLKPSLFTPGTPEQAQHGENDIQQAQRVTQQFDATQKQQ